MLNCIIDRNRTQVKFGESEGNIVKTAGNRFSRSAKQNQTGSGHKVLRYYFSSIPLMGFVVSFALSHYSYYTSPGPAYLVYFFESLGITFLFVKLFENTGNIACDSAVRSWGLKIIFLSGLLSGLILLLATFLTYEKICSISPLFIGPWTTLILMGLVGSGLTLLGSSALFEHRTASKTVVYSGSLSKNRTRKGKIVCQPVFQ